MEAFLSTLPSVGVQSSVVVNIYDGSLGADVRGGCAALTAFAQDDIYSKLITLTPIMLTFASTGSPDENITKSVFTCTGDRSTANDPLDQIIASFSAAPGSSGTDQISTVTCNSQTVKTGTCASGKPAICVGCSNPCAHDRIKALGCSSTGTASRMNLMRVDFAPLAVPAAISSVVAVPRGTTSLSVRVQLSEAEGFLVCNAYPTRTSFVPSAVSRLALNRPVQTITQLHMVYNITNLRPSTSYDVYCGTFSALNAPMAAADMQATKVLVETACCRDILVSLALTSFSDNSDVGKAVSIDVGILPSTDVTVTLTTTFKATSSDSFAPIASPFIPSARTFSLSSQTSLMFVAYNKSAARIGTYSITATLSGTAAAKYAVKYPTGRQFIVKLSTVQPPPPVLSSAVFSSNGARVRGAFNAPTNRGGVLNVLSRCSDYFTLSGLTSSTRCVWVDDFSIDIFASGANGPVVAGTVAVKANMIKAKCTIPVINGGCTTWNSTSAASVTIAPPTEPLRPSVVIAGPSQVGACDDVSIDITRSSGSGGRPWSSITFTVTSNAPNKSDVEAYLNGVIFQNKAIRIANTLLNQRRAYSITAKMCNFLGACGQGVFSFVVSSSTNVPVVSINADQQFSVNRYNRLSISGQAYTSACGAGTTNADLSYKWSVYKAGVLQPQIVSLSNDRQEFLRPPYSLPVGDTYTVMLTATHGISGKYSSVSVDVTVTQGDIIAKVNKPSSFGVRVTDTVTLSAADSYDRDYNDVTGSAAGLTFDISCVQTFPSFTENCGLVVTGSAGVFSISVPGAALSFVDSKHLLTIYVLHAASDRVAEVSVELVVLPSLAAVVTLSAPDADRFNPNNKFIVSANIEYAFAGVAAWTVDDSSLSLNDVATSLVTRSLPVRQGGVSTNMQTSLILPSYSLAEMSVYTFSLTVTLSNGLKTIASVAVSTNSPPTRGVLSVTPPNGTEYDTMFTFVAASFEDPDLPLSYAFSFAGTGKFVVLRERKTVSYSSNLLPEGPDTLDYAFETRVQVYDILDGKTEAFGSVKVISNAEVNNSLLVNAMESSLTDGSTSDLTAAASIVSEMLNSAECVSAPDCASLNRQDCSKVDNTCGSCLDGFTGRGRYANTLCISESGGTSVDSAYLRGFSSVATACSSDSECNANAYEVCTSGICQIGTLTCPSDCSGNGECVYINKYSSPDDDDYYYNSACSVLNNNCEAKCECSAGMAGSGCQHTTEAFAEAQSLRHLVIQAYDTLVDTQTPSQDVVIAWIDGIVNVASYAADLSLETKQLIVVVSQKILDIANTLDLAYEDVSDLEVALELTLDAVSAASTGRRLDVGDDIVSLFDAFAQYIINDMLPDQLAIEIVTDLFRITANAYDGVSSVVLNLPQSGAEVVAGSSSQSVVLPEDPGSYKVLLYELVALVHATGASPFLQSVPVTMKFDRSLCSGAVGDIDACSFNITFINYEYGQHGTTAEEYTDRCQEGAMETFTHSCPVGDNISVTCDGNFDGYVVSVCPTREMASVCASVGTYNTECRVLRYSESETVCKCSLPGSTDSYDLAVASAASEKVVGGSTDMFRGGGDFPDNAAQAYPVVICTMVTLGVTLLAVLVTFCTSSSVDGKTQPTFQDDQLAEVSLPHVFRKKGILEHLWNEVATHHRWLSLVFNKSPVMRKDFHLLSLWTSVLIFFFVQSIVYNLADKDERDCKYESTSREDCESEKSFLALGEPTCRWDGSEKYCVFNEPDSSVLRIVFCAVFVAILTVPCHVLVNYVISDIICAAHTEGGAAEVAPDGFAGAAPVAGKSEIRVSSKTVNAEYDEVTSAIRTHGDSLGAAKREFESELYVLKRIVVCNIVLCCRCVECWTETSRRT